MREWREFFRDNIVHFCRGGSGGRNLIRAKLSIVELSRWRLMKFEISQLRLASV